MLGRAPPTGAALISSPSELLVSVALENGGLGDSLELAQSLGSQCDKLGQVPGCDGHPDGPDHVAGRVGFVSTTGITDPQDPWAGRAVGPHSKPRGHRPVGHFAHRKEHPRGSSQAMPQRRRTGSRPGPVHSPASCSGKT